MVGRSWGLENVWPFNHHNMNNLKLDACVIAGFDTIKKIWPTNPYGRLKDWRVDREVARRTTRLVIQNAADRMLWRIVLGKGGALYGGEVEVQWGGVAAASDM